VALSSGEQKLVSLARALVLDSELVFFDEPLSFLDDSSVDRVLGVLAEGRSRGKTQLIVSHSNRLASLVADIICVVDLGWVHAMGDYEEIRRSRDPLVRSVTGRLAERA
jgi:ABC-type polar amino acid transport system ATPase subunit